MRDNRQIKCNSYCERRRVDDNEGILYYFENSEKGHQKKHIHAKYEKYETSIGLNPVETIVPSKLPTKKHRTALLYIKKHQKKLIRLWNIYVLTDNIANKKQSLSSVFRIRKHMVLKPKNRRCNICTVQRRQTP